MVLLLILLLGSLTWAAPRDGNVPSTLRTGARIEASEQNFQAGQVPAYGRPLVHAFPLRNGGSTPLRIERVEKICDCVTYHLESRDLAPGQTAWLVLIMDISDKRGRFLDGVRIYSNCARAPEFQLVIEGHAYRRLEIRPERFDLGEQPREFLERKVFTINFEINDDVIGLDRLAVSSARLTADLQESGENGHLIQVRLQPGPVAETEFRESVSIFLSGTEPSRIDIPVTALVKGAIEVSPRQLYLDEILKQSPPTRAVYFACPESFQVLKADLPPFVSWEAAPLTRRRQGKPVQLQKITLRLDPAKLPAAPARSVLRFHTDRPDTPEVLVFLDPSRFATPSE